MLIAPNSQGERKKGELITFLGQRSLLLNACVDLSSGVYRTRAKESFSWGIKGKERRKKSVSVVFSPLLLRREKESKIFTVAPFLKCRPPPLPESSLRKKRRKVPDRAKRRQQMAADGHTKMGKGVSESSLASYSGNCGVFPYWKTVLNIISL